ncbi:MAG: hypothetical protein AAGC67_17020 [Myxococcota bacterium]
MSNARPAYATELLEIDRPHAEILDPTTGQVWQTLAGCGPDALAALDLPAPLQSLGAGTAAMDEHWFDRAPGAAEDGPLETRTIAGHEWGHCARPASAPAKPFGEDGPIELHVDKHHALRFRAGRRIPVLKTPEGEDFVHVIARPRDADPLAIPDGCRLGEVVLTEDWILRLPQPTRVFFFGSGDSFQGPLAALPDAWKEIT